MRHETLVDIGKVVSINLAAFGISLADVEISLKIVSLLIGIIYGAWKFITDWKKWKREKFISGRNGQAKR